MFTLGLPKQPTFYSTENYLGWVSFGIGTTSFTIDTYHKPKMGTSHRYIIWRFQRPIVITLASYTSTLTVLFSSVFHMLEF